MNPIIAIDPGATGALAILYPDEWTIEIHRTPYRSVTVSGKERKEVDPQALSGLIVPRKPRLMVTEKLHARPAPTTSQANFNLGRAFGQIEMIAATQGYPIIEPTPQAWKNRMVVTADKDLSRKRAAQLIPDAAECFRLKKSHDLAEAGLLALYGVFFLGMVPGKISYIEPSKGR
jgi:crossover junction endodeoxyribonuclease RuvC